MSRRLLGASFAMLAIALASQTAAAGEESYGSCVGGKREVTTTAMASQSVLGYILPKRETKRTEPCTTPAYERQQAEAKKQFLNAKPVEISGTEKMCREQYVVIDQTYDMYKQGLSEQQAVVRQTDRSTSPRAMAWVKKVVRSIYAEPRSMHTDGSTTAFIHEQKCNQHPEQYKF